MRTYCMRLSVLRFDNTWIYDTSILEVMWLNAFLFRKSENLQVAPKLINFVLHIGEQLGALKRFEE
jgi:hypothetical protein